MKRILLIPITWALFGCATVDPNAVTLTIYSEPAGAMLYINNQHIGTAPQKGTFKITDANRTANQVTTSPVTAIWPSGASVTTPLRMWLDRGSTHNYTFRRPPNHPGIEKDIAAASQPRGQQQDEGISGEGVAIFLQFLGAAVQGYNAGRASTSGITPYQPSQGSNQPAQVIKKIEPPKSYNCRGSYSGSGQYTCDER